MRKPERQQNNSHIDAAALNVSQATTHSAQVSDYNTSKWYWNV
jgi:hypothetical protein